MLCLQVTKRIYLNCGPAEDNMFQKISENVCLCIQTRTPALNEKLGRAMPKADQKMARDTTFTLMAWGTIRNTSTHFKLNWIFEDYCVLGIFLSYLCTMALTCYAKLMVVVLCVNEKSMCLKNMTEHMWTT